MTDKLLSDNFLLKSFLSRKLSKYPTDYNQYDFRTMYVDMGNARANYINTLPLDKRAIAVSTDYYIHKESLMQSETPGWVDMQEIIANHYIQMIASLIKPTNALFLSLENAPVAVKNLYDNNCKITACNSYTLKFYNDFWEGHPECDYQIDYDVIDMQDISNLDESLLQSKFDFIYFPGVVISWEEELLDNLLELLSPGGTLLLLLTNDIMRLYSPEYYKSPIYFLHEKIMSRTDIYNFHIPDSTGWNVIIKK